MAKKKPMLLPSAPTTDKGLDSLYADLRFNERVADSVAAAGTPKEPTLGERIKAAWDSESSIAATLQYLGNPEFTPDSKYVPTSPEEWTRITKDIPPEYHSNLLNSVSAAHADYKRKKIQEELSRMETIGGGASGFALQAGAILADPATWALSSMSGGAVTLAKLSRMRRFLVGGSLAGTENAILEAYLAKAQETRDESDVAFAGLMGFAVGGPLSALLKPSERTKLSAKVNEALDAADAKALERAGVVSPEKALELSDPVMPAKVLTKEEILARIEADAKAATDEVVADIKAKSEATMPKSVAPAKRHVLSEVDRAKLKARVEREDAEWLKKQAVPEEPKQVVSTQSDAPLENALQAALRPLQEARVAAKAGAKKAKQEDSAWDRYERENLAAKKQTEELAYAQRETQLADNPDLIPEPKQQTAQDSPQATIKDESSLTPQETLPKQPEAPTQAAEASADSQGDTLVAVGDNITVELPDGRIVGGRIKSFNEDTGFAVIDDELSGKPVRVNLNEVNVDEVMDNTGFIESGSIGSAQVLPIEMAKPIDLVDDTGTALTYFRIPFTNFRIPLRFDYYAKFLTQENTTLRRLAKILLADSVGNLDHSGRGLNASELAQMDWQKYKGQFFVTANDAFEAYAKEQGYSAIQRVTKREEFFTMVTKAVRDYSTSQYVHPQVGKVVLEVQRIHKEMLELAQKYGVKGAEEIFPDPFYMMRKFHHDRIIQLAKRFGDNQLIQLVKGAIRSVRPVTDEMAERIARNYVIVVRGLPYEDMNKMRMGDEGKARFRAIADELQIDQDIVDELFEMVLAKPGKVEGDSGRLKSRTLLNENFSMKLTDNEGKTVEVSMDDFFENDASILMDLYTRQMSGHIALAKMGIRSDADFEKLLNEAKQESLANFHDYNKFEENRAHMRDVYNHILGRPMSTEVFGKAARISKAVRDLNFIRMMGQVGFAQLAEIGNLLIYGGMRAMAKQMPSFSELIRAAKGGLVDEKLARDLANMGGLGTEMASMQPLARSTEDAMFDVGLTKAERALAYGRYGTAIVSGLAPITSFLRQKSSAVFVQKFSDYARGLDKLSKGDMDRMAWSGIDADNYKAVYRDIKKYVQVEGKNSTVHSIDWEKWAKESPETYETFRMAIWRESRRVIQEQTIGETAPWMHHWLGKILTQFRGFMLVAHAKQTLYGIHHSSKTDFTPAMALMASSLFGGLSYIGQTSLNYAGNPEELEKRLTLEEIAKSAFQRASASAMVPSVIDTGLQFAGYDAFFKYGRSSSLGSGFIMGNPTYDWAVNKVGGTASNIAQMFTTDDYMVTEQDAKNAIYTIVPNLIGLRTLIEAATDDLPDYNYLRDYQQ